MSQFTVCSPNEAQLPSASNCDRTLGSWAWGSSGGIVGFEEAIVFRTMQVPLNETAVLAGSPEELNQVRRAVGIPTSHVLGIIGPSQEPAD